MPISDQYSAAWIPATGSVVGARYEVLQNLDKGGMGVVLKAHDTVADVDVAIKMVSPKLGRTENYRERFAREVELATEIEHRNVIRCLDFGETESGALFLVMELLDGLPLLHHIRNEARLSTGVALQLGIQALAGLAAAHRHEIIHRDLKPDNIYLVPTETGYEVKLLDFGLAKSLRSEEVRLTRTGAICGTAAYVAPETLVVEEPGKAGDVYSMGLVVLEMLFGRRVYPSNQMAQTFMEQLVVPARIPRRVWEQPFGRVIARALQKHPGERFADANEMYDAMAAVVEQTEDFVLGNEEIPPAATELPRELLDDLADGRYRTVDTLHKMPAPEPWDASDDAVDDREVLSAVLADISRSDMDAAFDEILKEEIAEELNEQGDSEDAIDDQTSAPPPESTTCAPYHGLPSVPAADRSGDHPGRSSTWVAVGYGVVAILAVLASIYLAGWWTAA